MYLAADYIHRTPHGGAAASASTGPSWSTPDRATVETLVGARIDRPRQTRRPRGGGAMN
jgi:hypothetical protein